MQQTQALIWSIASIFDQSLDHAPPWHLSWYLCCAWELRHIEVLIAINTKDETPLHAMPMQYLYYILIELLCLCKIHWQCCLNKVTSRYIVLVSNWFKVARWEVQYSALQTSLALVLTGNNANAIVVMELDLTPEFQA